MDVLTEVKSRRRLIVLLPDCLASNADLASKIHGMANQEDLSVMYLVMVEDGKSELALLRYMAAMRSVTSGNRLIVESKITSTTSWLEDLRMIVQPGDILVCHEEQTAINRDFKLSPVKDFLVDYVNIPICTLSGYYQPHRTKARKCFHELFSLAGFLVIMAVFTWLQIQLDQAFDGFLQTIFVLMTLGIELSAMWLWYKLVYV